MVIFKDSQFLAAAWKQLLETRPHDLPVFSVHECQITGQEVLLVLNGNSDNMEVVSAISEYFVATVIEAMRIVRGRFAKGLDNPEATT